MVLIKKGNYSCLLERTVVMSGKITPAFLLPVFFFFSFGSFAFQSSDCDEVPVTILMDDLGQTELSSFLCGEEVYFSVPELFDFLKIKNIPANDLSVVEGFITNQHDSFQIDAIGNKIIYRNIEYSLEEADFIRTRTNLFLKAVRFEEVFGLENDFNQRFLSSSLRTELELPSIKAARRERMRNNIRKIQNRYQADTTVLRNRPLFHFGAAGWNLNSVQRTDGIHHNRFNLGLGGLLAGGEFTGNFNYSTTHDLSLRNQFYQWRYVNNESKTLRQITGGKIGARSVSSVFNPIVGVQLTNTPTYLKKSFGTYELSDYTQPNWMVELYINDVLVDYIQADVSGFFAFDVPIMYGITKVSLRYYGPWGEEEVSHTQFNIPYNFLPAKEFLYSVSSGVVEDGKGTIFAQTRIDYGITDRVTLGGGVEYLSSLEKKPLIPFLNSSVRLPYNLLVSGEYLHEVGYRANLNYAAPSGPRLELNYSKYNEEQEAVRFSYLEERRVSLSHPLDFKNFQGTSRFSFRQNILRQNSFTNLEWLITGRTFGYKINLTNLAFYNVSSNPLIFSRLSTSFRIPGNVTFSPQIEYQYRQNRISSIRGEFRKKLSESIHLLSSYDQDFRIGQFYLNFGVTFDLGFTRAGISSSTTRNHTSFAQSAGGSFIFDPTDNNLKFDNRAVIGRGSIKFIPFLDLNGNGRKDEMEPETEGVNVHLSGGGVKEIFPGGATVFRNLEPYLSYHVNLDTRNLDRIAWRVEHKTLNIIVNPNQVRLIEVPIQVVGEVAGFVYDSGDGIGGIKINIFNEKDHLLTSVISEGDGYFSYLGLKSGNYEARIDAEQLERLGLTADGNFKFSINNTEEGDYVDNLKFLLTDLNGNATEGEGFIDGSTPVEHVFEGNISERTPILEELIKTSSGEKPTVESKIAQTTIRAHQLSGNGNVQEVDSSRDLWEQDKSTILAFKTGNPNKENEGLIYKVQVLTSKKLLPENDLTFKGIENIAAQLINDTYHYRLGATRSPVRAAKLQEELRAAGFEDAFVVHFFNGKQIPVEEAVSVRRKLSDFTSENTEKRHTRSLAGNEVDPYLRAQIAEGKNKGMVTSEYEVSNRETIKMESAPSVTDSTGSRRKNPVNDGLVFKVQVMASKTKLFLDDSLFQGLAGIQEHKHEGLYKYTWGVSSSFRDANQMKNQLRNQEFPDAFVVPFHNNNRLSRWQVEGYVLLKEEQMNGLGGIKINLYNTGGDRVATALSEVDGSFKIPGLIPGLYTAAPDQAELKRLGMRSLSGLYEFRIDRSSGISTKTIQFFLESTHREPATLNKPKVGIQDGLVFRVQVLATIPKLPVNHKLLKGLKEVERHKNGGMYTYIWGRSSTLEGAREIRKQLQNKGFEDAFIVTFFNNKRMNLQEATGKIVMNSAGKFHGMEGIRVHIYDSKKDRVTSLVSDRDGSFSFLGLRPGVYVAHIDREQLRELKLKAETASFKFTIGRSKEGTIIDPLQFLVKKVMPLPIPSPQHSDGGQEDHILYKVQIAASKVELLPNHPAFKRQKGIQMYRHEEMYKYTLGTTFSFAEAKLLEKKLKKQGFQNAFIVSFLNGIRINTDHEPPPKTKEL